MTFLIRNGVLLDGLGTAPRRTDLFLREGRIAAIGDLGGVRADDILDAKGFFVLPGVIDGYTTVDHHGSLFRSPEQDSFLSHGVTSIVVGHDGVSLAPWGGDHASLLDHGSLGGMNGGWDDPRGFARDLRTRAPGVHVGLLAGWSSLLRTCRSEWHRAREMANRFLSSGALGISFAPGDGWSKKDAHAIRGGEQYGSVYRPGVHNSWEWHVPSEAHHSLFSLLPSWARRDGRTGVLERLSDPWFSSRVLRDLPPIHPQTFRVVGTHDGYGFSGKSLGDLMEQWGIYNTSRALLHLMEATRLRAVVSFVGEGDALDAFLASPRSLLATRDTGLGEGGSSLYPSLLSEAYRRGPDVLADLSRRISRDVASAYGMTDRGVLQEGMSADLLVLGPSGISSVFVSGNPVYADGVFSNSRQGSVISA
jgi:N-acyl-D-aspartate/D-glutamate deacylase